MAAHPMGGMLVPARRCGESLRLVPYVAQFDRQDALAAPESLCRSSGLTASRAIGRPAIAR
ncbi:hypothetical protein [uncultured Sphingomonas sp.]|jgi:hypothetical protein|uniref:hypothetical protein n=1 Tax=uncultured Sphingomonas sp. TaxID=158754 RepID=UPI0025FADFA4|nr:hypothetical protein [uncultured Sphingomonas sp.]